MGSKMHFVAGLVLALALVLPRSSMGGEELVLNPDSIARRAS